MAQQKPKPRGRATLNGQSNPASGCLELTEVGQPAVEDQGVEGAEMAAVYAHLCGYGLSS